MPAPTSLTPRRLLLSISALLFALCAFCANGRADTIIGAGDTATFTVNAINRTAGSVATSGEGVLSLTMAGPDTSWADASNTAVVVEADVDGGQPQTFVLFDGALPFTYQGFTGTLSAGTHSVSLTVDAALSRTSVTPVAVVSSASLIVVPADDPAYQALAHAPALYERAVASHGDVPLLQYVTDTPNQDNPNVHHLEYQTIWSHEDVGDTIVPANELGKWGRMTDIDPTIWFDLDKSSGAIGNPTMDGCSFCPPQYPEDLPGDDADVSFHGSYFSATHPILRVSTGNNNETDAGTTAIRIQQVLVPPPAAGQTREQVMDINPWTYRIMNEEMVREYAAQYSTDPHNFLPGDARQYAIIDLDIAAPGAASVAVELTLSDRATYSNDYVQASPAGVPSTYPFYAGGHGRTVVKVPVNWHDSTIDKINLRLNYLPADPPPVISMVKINTLRVLELTADYQIATRYDFNRPRAALPTFSTFPELVPVAP